MPIQGSTQTVTEDHLKIMAEKLFSAMGGLWQIIEDHGTDSMKKYRDDHLSALGIVMNPEGVDGCGACPACKAKLAEGGTLVAVKGKAKYDA